MNGGVRCPPDFVPGKLHFKNNFCDNCRDGIMVPLAHVCALSAEQAACFVNKRSKGFWNHAPPANMGGGQYRIVNNTAGCIGPWLAVFREEPPHLAWSAHARSRPQPVHHGTLACFRALPSLSLSLDPPTAPPPPPRPSSPGLRPRPTFSLALAHTRVNTGPAQIRLSQHPSHAS